MTLDVRWIVSTRASSLRALAALLAGQTLVDQKTATALADEARAWRADLDILGLDAETFFRHAIPLATQIDSPDARAEAVRAKAREPWTPDRPPVHNVLDARQSATALGQQAERRLGAPGSPLRKRLHFAMRKTAGTPPTPVW